jgi:hypothetical protein
MKISSLICLVLAIVILVSVASIWLYPSSQDFMASNNTWNGIRDFSRHFKVKELDSLNGLPPATGKEVLICLPYLEYNAAELAAIKQFVEQGGNLLLMDDFGFGNDILTALGSKTRFDHNLLLDPLFCYKNQNLPCIVDFVPKLKHEGLSVIILNHATVLQLEDKTQALAWSSGTSYLDKNNNGQQDAGEPYGPFPVAAGFQAGPGKVTLVSDPSLIINAMDKQEDNLVFISKLISDEGQTMQVMLDNSHLEKSTLDDSRDKLGSFRRSFSSPYILIGLIAAVFIMVIVYTLKKGEILG